MCEISEMSKEGWTKYFKQGTVFDASSFKLICLGFSIRGKQNCNLANAEIKGYWEVSVCGCGRGSKDFSPRTNSCALRYLSSQGLLHHLFSNKYFWGILLSLSVRRVGLEDTLCRINPPSFSCPDERLYQFCTTKN